MHVQLVAHRMHPEPRAVGGNGNFGRAVHFHEIRRFDAVEQLADVDVRVALRAPLVAVDGQAPLIAPQRFALFDGGVPQRERAPPASCRRARATWARGSASQRFGLRGLMSFRKKTAASAGWFSASRHRPHSRAAMLSGLASRRRSCGRRRAAIATVPTTSHKPYEEHLYPL